MPTHYDGTPAERRALDAFIKLSRAAETASTRINAHLHQHDLTISQFGVLEALYHLGPLQPSELAAKILKSTANLTTVLDNLERRHLVERHRRTDDRRRLDVHLTDAGHALVHRLLPDHVRGVVAFFDVLTAEEQKQLVHLCRAVGTQ